MAVLASLPMPSPQEEQLRLAPHNIEAEQALLGALMVHNEAYDRVSDFLRPEHFYEEIHARIYENAGKLIHAGKIATAITLKNFLPDQDLGGMTVAQYLVRLTQSATTIINAIEYGRVIYDLALRRNLIIIGEDMVNLAFDAPEALLVVVLADRVATHRAPPARSGPEPYPPTPSSRSRAPPRSTGRGSPGARSRRSRS